MAGPFVEVAENHLNVGRIHDRLLVESARIIKVAVWSLESAKCASTSGLQAVPTPMARMPSGSSLISLAFPDLQPIAFDS